MRLRTALPVFLAAAALVTGMLPGQAGAIDGTEDIFTVAGTGDPDFSGDGGPATDADLYNPAGLAVDADGNVYVAEENNHRVRRIDAATGIITTFAGNGGANVPVDGSLAIDSDVGHPSGLAFDSAGNLYVSQPGFSRVRRIDAVTGIITAYAGKGVSGNAGDGGPATDAELRSPAGLAFDSSDNLYIATYAGNKVRRVDAATGIITTYAGNGTTGNDGNGGPAVDAGIRNPRGIAFDADDNLYIADDDAHVVRKVDGATGIIDEFAGDGFIGNTGDGGPAVDARFSEPWDVAVAPNGDVYIAVRSNYSVRKVDADTGIITTVMGSGSYGFSGDGGPANEAEMGTLNGIAVSANGRVYASDDAHDRVRSAAPPATAPDSPTGVSGVAGDGEVKVSWSAPGNDGGSAITGYKVTASPGGAACSTSSTSCVVDGLSNGTAYTFTVVAINAIGTGSPSAKSGAVTPKASSNPSPSPSPSPSPPGSGFECPTVPVRVDDSNRDGAAIALWVCNMHLVGGEWQGEIAVVLLPNGWFGCPDPAERRWYQPGNEFGGWLIQNHCGYVPTIAPTWFGPWFAWDPPAANPFWLAHWASTRG